jgi:hypothetical protein
MDPGGLRRQQRRRHRDLRHHLGLAFAALVAAGLPVFSQGEGESEDPVWDEALSLWREEGLDLARRRADAGEREGAVDASRAFIDRLEQAVKKLSAAVYYLAYEMAEKEQYTPDLEDRLAFLKLASACALVVGSETAAARSEHERARQLHQAYRLQEARDVLQRALELYPGGKSTLGFVIIQLADLER